MPDTPDGTRRLSASLLWGIGLLLAAVLPPLAAPWLAPYDPGEINPTPAPQRPPGTALAVVRLSDGSSRLADRAERVPAGLRLRIGERSEILPAGAVANLTTDGVADHRRFLLGTDHLGRDLWSRLLYGGRISLLIGTVSVLLALTLGITIGSAAALGGRFLDTVLMRLVDAFLAFPWIFLIITLAALFSPGLGPLVLILGGTGWMTISRLIRAEIKSLKQREFVLAARALGQHPFRIFWRHLLPNALTPVLIQAALLVGNVILAESSLSFLGFGVQPPTPSWGNMVAEGRSPSALFSTWWVAVFPGAAIALTVIALNLLGDGLRDALDPRHRGARPADATLPPL
ncbi:MAG TPA: ABC transporter permease [Thermoanaerobaculia bacterium]|nr:ABC transporter permease [Thermoanaerobaculia bacterium]